MAADNEKELQQLAKRIEELARKSYDHNISQDCDDGLPEPLE